MANTPNLDLVKPAGTDHALVSVINSNSDKIDAGFGTLSEQIGKFTPVYLSGANQSGFETAIVNMLATMSNYAQQPVYAAVSANVSSYMYAGTIYMGTLYKNTGSTGELTLYHHSYPAVVVKISNGSCTWDNLATKSELTNKFVWTTFLSESNVSIGNTYASTGKSFTLSKPSLVRVEMTYGSGRPLAIGLKVSESAVSGSVALNSIYENDISDTSGLAVTALLPAGTYYVWARTASATGSSNIAVYGMPLGA